MCVERTKKKNGGRKQSKKQRKSRGRNIKRMIEREKGKERYICEREREEKELSFFPREMVETAIF